MRMTFKSYKKIPKWSRPSGVRAVIVLLVLFVVYSQSLLISHVWRYRHSSRLGMDDGTLYEQRFAEIRKYLPQRGIIGYVSDTGDEHFYRTQYVLAPLILVRADGPRLVVGNFSSIDRRPDLLYGRPYEVIYEFNEGLVLLTIRNQ